ncbi:MAG: hypothetical protein JSW43_05525, partial [Gemmatimonadota bacterium]
MRFRKGAPAAPASICRAGWRAAGRGGAVLLTLCLTGQAAWAEDAEEPGWIPSINLGFDTFAYDTLSSVENHLNPPAHEGTQSYFSTELKFQSGAELMSPRLALPG